MNTGTQLANPGLTEILTFIIGITKSLGWFTQRQWHPEICGKIVNNIAEGGILNTLEEQTGKTYPRLRGILQEVVNSFRTFQWAAPWDKKATAEAYDKKLREFTEAVRKETEKWAQEHKVELKKGIWDWIKENWLFIGLGASFTTLIGIILITKRKK